MQEMMFCGTGSFKDVDKDACGAGEKKAPDAKAKKKKPGKKENPYASRGLDKFSTVVAELESRREKILRRVGPVGGDHVMVRFGRSEAKGWVPIVVKLPPEEQQQAADAKKCKPAAPTSKTSTPPTEPASPREDVKPTAAAKATAVAAPPPAKAAAKKKAADEGRSWGKSKLRPHHYMPFVAVLLLVSLVVFGRVFAVCCTSIWWYLVPILSGSNGGEEGQGVRRAMAKVGKDLDSKKTSDKKIGEKLVAPLPSAHGKKSSSGAHEVISPRSHEVISPRSHAHGKKG